MLIRADAGKRSSWLGLKISYERRIFLMALLAGLPGIMGSVVMVWWVPDTIVVWGWTVDMTETARWQFTAAIVGAWLFLSSSLRRNIIFPLQTVSNLLAALREGDFSVRGRDGLEGHQLHAGDTLEELTREVNAFANTLHEQRLGALEATALLRKVMEEIGVAVFAFDEDHSLKLLNKEAARLLNVPAERALDHSAESLGLAEYLEESAPRLFNASFSGGSGRWEIRRSLFRQGGKPHQLLVFSDLTRTLREEELQAWQRIVRVIGHELNNSLAPIKSISGSLQSIMSRKDRSDDWEEDIERGLAVISSRSESLGRFMTAYARLARLPQPKVQSVEVGPLVRRVVGLETRMAITLQPGPEMTIAADPDQIEQLLINLIKNAVEASTETGGSVCVTWRQVADSVEMRVEDEGPGLANTSNLFVPFFTTKPGGSGIGLVLSRQIAEAHGGSLRLENRTTGRGCVASLRLPL